MESAPLINTKTPYQHPTNGKYLQQRMQATAVVVPVRVDQSYIPYDDVYPFCGLACFTCGVYVSS